MADKVESVEVDGLSGEYLLLTDQMTDLRAFKAPEQAAVNVLPCSDPYMTGYKTRERYLDKDHYYSIFDRSGNPTYTIHVDGRTVGVWDLPRKDDQAAKYHLFDEVSPEIDRMIKNELLRMAQFSTEKSVSLRRCIMMTPLSEQTAGSFMSPLKSS